MGKPENAVPMALAAEEGDGAPEGRSRRAAPRPGPPVGEPENTASPTARPDDLAAEPAAPQPFAEAPAFPTPPTSCPSSAASRDAIACCAATDSASCPASRLTVGRRPRAEPGVAAPPWAGSSSNGPTPAAMRAASMARQSSADSGAPSAGSAAGSASAPEVCSGSRGGQPKFMRPAHSPSPNAPPRASSSSNGEMERSVGGSAEPKSAGTSASATASGSPARSRSNAAGHRPEGCH